MQRNRRRMNDLCYIYDRSDFSMLSVYKEYFYPHWRRSDRPLSVPSGQTLMLTLPLFCLQINFLPCYIVMFVNF